MRTLAVLADGFGHHYLANPRVRDAYAAFLPHAAPLRTLLGYSAGLHPVIWSGLDQRDMPYWSKWGIPPGETLGGDLAFSPLAWKATAVAKTLLRDLARVPGIKDPAVPSAVKRRFRKLEADDAEPFRHPGAHTLFDLMDAQGLGWRYHFCPKAKHLPARLPSEPQVNVLLYGGIDGAGHDHGPDHRRTEAELLSFARWLKDAAQEHDDVLVFSDHGMFPVHARVDYGRLIRKAVPERDLLLFLDATIVRCWWSEARTGEKLKAFLRTLEGATVEEKDYEAHDVPAGSTFGMLMFVPPGGVEVYPNYFHPLYPRWFLGLHGYMPGGAYSDGVMMSTRPLRAEAGDMRDVTPTLAAMMGAKPHPSWKGRSLL